LRGDESLAGGAALKPPLDAGGSSGGSAFAFGGDAAASADCAAPASAGSSVRSSGTGTGTGGAAAVRTSDAAPESGGGFEDGCDSAAATLVAGSCAEAALGASGAGAAAAPACATADEAGPLRSPLPNIARAPVIMSLVASGKTWCATAAPSASVISAAMAGTVAREWREGAGGLARCGG
jgi:hypothetical protein